jgi:chromosome segregation ATPase
MTIHIELQVVLPALDASSRPPANVLASWAEFVSGVAAHEQRHVDIYMRGAEQVRDRMQALAPAAGCAALETQVNGIWDRQQRATDQEQERFHSDERLRIESLRAPLRTQIESGRARLDGLTAEISAIDVTLNTLSSQITPLKTLLSELTSQMGAIESRYAGQPLPSDAYRQYESLRGQYNNLIPSHNALVAQYNTQTAQRAELLQQAQQQRDQLNVLIDNFNWTR